MKLLFSMIVFSVTVWIFSVASYKTIFFVWYSTFYRATISLDRAKFEGFADDD